MTEVLSYAGDAVHSLLDTDLPRVGSCLPWVKLSLRQVIGHTVCGYATIIPHRYVGHTSMWSAKEFITSNFHT